MKVTIVDIASMASVSPATVSRTQERFPDHSRSEEAGQNCRSGTWVPAKSFSPGGLVSSRSHAIGYVVDNLSWSFYSELAESVQTAAEEVKYGSYIYSSLKHPGE